MSWGAPYRFQAPTPFRIIASGQDPASIRYPPPQQPLAPIISGSYYSGKKYAPLVENEDVGLIRRNRTSQRTTGYRSMTQSMDSRIGTSYYTSTSADRPSRNRRGVGRSLSRSRRPPPSDSSFRSDSEGYEAPTERTDASESPGLVFPFPQYQGQVSPQGSKLKMADGVVRHLATAVPAPLAAAIMNSSTPSPLSPFKASRSLLTSKPQLPQPQQQQPLPPLPRVVLDDDKWPAPSSSSASEDGNGFEKARGMVVRNPDGGLEDEGAALSTEEEEEDVFDDIGGVPVKRLDSWSPAQIVPSPYRVMSPVKLPSASPAQLPSPTALPFASPAPPTAKDLTPYSSPTPVPTAYQILTEQASAAQTTTNTTTAPLSPPGGSFQPGVLFPDPPPPTPVQQQYPSVAPVATAVSLPPDVVRHGNGIVEFQDGSMQMPDGTNVYPDGTGRHPDGTRVQRLADGSLQLLYGAWLLSDKSIRLSSGKIRLLNGSVQNPDGTFAYSATGSTTGPTVAPPSAYATPLPPPPGPASPAVTYQSLPYTDAPRVRIEPPTPQPSSPSGGTQAPLPATPASPSTTGPPAPPPPDPNAKPFIDPLPPNSAIKLMPDKSLRIPDGSTLYPNGHLLLKDGTYSMADPRRGFWKLSDGRVLMPNGTIQNAAPLETAPVVGGAKKSSLMCCKRVEPPPPLPNPLPPAPAGSIRAPDGTVRYPNGVMKRPEGHYGFPDGSYRRANGGVFTKQGEPIMAMDTLGTRYQLTDGTILDISDYSLTTRNGCIKMMDGKTKLPGGAIMQRDGSIRRSDGLVVWPDSKTRRAPIDDMGTTIATDLTIVSADGSEKRVDGTVYGPTIVLYKLGALVRDMESPADRGVTVRQLIMNGPLLKSDIHAGEILKTWNDTPLRSTYQLKELVTAASPGTVIRIGVPRGIGSISNIPVTICNESDFPDVPENPTIARPTSPAAVTVRPPLSPRMTASSPSSSIPPPTFGSSVSGSSSSSSSAAPISPRAASSAVPQQPASVPAYTSSAAAVGSSAGAATTSSFTGPSAGSAFSSVATSSSSSSSSSAYSYPSSAASPAAPTPQPQQPSLNPSTTASSAAIPVGGNAGGGSPLATTAPVSSGSPPTIEVTPPSTFTSPQRPNEESNPDLLEPGGVRPTIGFEIKVIDDGFINNVIMVHSVTPGGPCDRAGIKQGDIIAAWEGVPLKSRETLSALLRGARINSNIKLTINRRGEILTKYVFVEGTTTPRPPPRVVPAEGS